jgi:hypothetical protein
MASPADGSAQDVLLPAPVQRMCFSACKVKESMYALGLIDSAWLDSCIRCRSTGKHAMLPGHVIGNAAHAPASFGAQVGPWFGKRRVTPSIRPSQRDVLGLIGLLTQEGMVSKCCTDGLKPNWCQMMQGTVLVTPTLMSVPPFCLFL